MRVTDLDCPGRDGTGREGSGTVRSRVLVADEDGVEEGRNLMDDQLLNMLSRSLFELESFSPLIDELLFPRQPVAGENAGKAVTVKGSKVPLSTSILDLKIECEDLLARWCAVVAQQCDGGTPSSRSIHHRAAWLQENLFVIDEMPWAEMCAEQIIAETRLLRDVVAPPESADDPQPLEVGTTREIVAWARHLGVQVSRTTVQRWVEQGAIHVEMAPDGRILVQLADVLDRARAGLLEGGPPDRLRCS